MTTSETTQDRPYQRLHGDAAQLAVRIRSLVKEEGAVILVSGMGKDHGSNQVAIRLGQSLNSLVAIRNGQSSESSSEGGAVLLIDADIRNSSVKEYFELDSTKGLADAVQGGSYALESIVENDSTRIAILPTVKSDETQLKSILSSIEHPLMDQLKQKYSIIVVSGPPDVNSFEFSVWATSSDQVILATGEGVRRSDVVEAKNTIERVGSALAGIVITHHD